MVTNARKNAEKFLEVKLSDSVEVRFYREIPNPDLAMYSVFITIQSSEEAFRSMMTDMKMKWKGMDTSIAAFLPASWNGPLRKSLSWWTPTGDTPELSAAKENGVNGWIIAKYENGRIFIYATDSGNGQSTDGPL